MSPERRPHAPRSVSRHPVHRRRQRVTIVVLIAIALVLGLALKGSLKRLFNSETVGHTSGGTAIDPSYFASGACEIFPPTSGDRGITVFLDAGHGGLDPGGIGETESGDQVEESHVNLPIELDALARLRSEGFQVVVSRTEDTTVIKLRPGDTDGQLLTLQGSHDDVAAHDVCANKSGARLLVGIYMDAGSSAQDAGSVSTYDTSRSFAAANLKLATLLQHDVLAAMNHQGWNIPNDGIVSDATEGSAVGDPADGGLAAESANYNHLLLLGPAASGFFSTPSAMPGAVIEPLFLTDPFEGSIAANAADQKIVADGIAKAVDQYFAPAKK